MKKFKLAVFFRWDEMGRYDIPASVDYVLNITRQSKLAAYFGYSLGCSAFFMGASDYNSRLNDQVDIMIGLGPSASFTWGCIGICNFRSCMFDWNYFFTLLFFLCL